MSLTIEGMQELLGARYRLTRELGGGSMAVVFLAEDARHGRAVAIKVLRPEYAATFAAERFLREIEIAARLQHPHIVPLLDSGEVGGHLYLVMPYVEGESLRVRLVREGRLPVGDVIRILADVADALAYAHGKGIIHRDIKPDNILLAGRHALVTDFGVAKAASVATVSPGRELTIGVALGTPTYMAPEQATADPGLDHRVDLYALGVVGYELLAGHPPFEGATAQAILTAHVLDAPPPIEAERPEVSPALAAILRKALAKAPAERWQSAEELLGQLEPLATPSGGTTPASVTPVSRRFGLARWVGAGVAALALLTAALLLLPRRSENTMVGTQRQVTFSGNVLAAAISPDGQLIAFVSESASRHRLMVQDLRGGQAIQLSSGRRMDYPSWSGDGSEVRVLVLDSTLYMLRRVPRLGGTPRDQVAAAWSALSPDGEQLAEVRQGGTRLTIRSMVTGDSVVRQLEPGWWQSVPAWSRDGERIAWAATQQSGRRSRIYVASVRQPAVQIALEDTLTFGSPGFDGPGRGLYYMQGTDRVSDLFHLSLDRTGNAAGPPELIRAGLSMGMPSTNVAFQPPPSISADGLRLVYSQGQEWSNLGMVALEAWRSGARPRLLTTGSASYEAARLSPDQRYLAFIRSESNGYSLQALPLGGGAPRELGRFIYGGELSWSPTGDRLIASVVDPDSGKGLRIFRLDGGRAWSGFFGVVGNTPEWLDDSTVIVPELGNRRLQLVRPYAGTRQTLPGVDTAGWMIYPRAAPDGRRVAFAWNMGKGRQATYALVLGGSPVLLAPGLVTPLRWSADGRSVYHSLGNFLAGSDQVVSVRADGSGQTVLASFPAGTEVVDVTSDGREAVLNLHEKRSDAWLIQFPARR